MTPLSVPQVLFWKLPAIQETTCNGGDPGLIPGLGGTPGEGNGNLLQFSSLGNPMNRGALWAIVHGVTRVGPNAATKPPSILMWPVSKAEGRGWG